MKQFGVLWIFISIMSVGLGICLITVSAINFTPEPISVCRIVVGSIWALCGAAMFVVSAKLIVSWRIKRALDKRKNNNVR